MPQKRHVQTSTKFFVSVTSCCGSVLLWWQCNTLCTSGFVDDVTFAGNGLYDAWLGERIVAMTHQGKTQIRYRRLYTVSHKTVQNRFCQYFFKFPPILIIFGRKMAKRLKLCKVHSFSTSPNLCHHATVLSADIPNCYTTLTVVSIAHNCIVNSIEGATWFNKFVRLNIW